MADVGEKLGFVAVGRFQLLVLILDFLEQPDVLDGDDSLVGKGFK